MIPFGKWKYKKILIYLQPVILVGGWPTPLKKYESQLGLLFPIYGKSSNSCSKPPTSYSCYNESLSSLWIPNNLDAGEVPIEWRKKPASIIVCPQLVDHCLSQRNSWIPVINSNNPWFSMISPWSIAILISLCCCQHCCCGETRRVPPLEAR